MTRAVHEPIPDNLILAGGALFGSSLCCTQNNWTRQVRQPPRAQTEANCVMPFLFAEIAQRQETGCSDTMAYRHKFGVQCKAIPHLVP